MTEEQAAPPRPRVGKTCIMLPQLVREGQLEVSMHTVPKQIERELRHIFGDQVDVRGMIIVPLFRRTCMPLVGVGAEVEAEKERHLEGFFADARAFVAAVRAAGGWADYTDPVSGFPMETDRRVSFYPDVLGAQMLLKQDVIAANCCSILNHNLFGTAVYPCTLFLSGLTPEAARDCLGALDPALTRAPLTEPVSQLPPS